MNATAVTPATRPATHIDPSVALAFARGVAAVVLDTPTLQPILRDQAVQVYRDLSGDTRPTVISATATASDQDRAIARRILARTLPDIRPGSRGRILGLEYLYYELEAACGVVA